MCVRHLICLLLFCKIACCAYTAEEAVLEDWTEWEVRSLKCVGLTHVDSTVILRELELLPGTGYSDRLLQEDAQAVKNTNLFARLVVSVDADSSAEAVDIIYAVSERPRYLAYPILTPTDKLGWVYGFGMMNRNLGGRGRTLDLEAEYGEHLNYSLHLIEPWFLGRRSPLSVFLNRKISQSADDSYERKSMTIRLGYRHYFNKEQSVSILPWWNEISIRDTGRQERRTVNPRNLDVYGGLALEWILNTTDLHVNPSCGLMFRAGGAGFGLGGKNQPSGSRAWLAHSRYFPVAGMVLAGNAGLQMTMGRTGDYHKHYLGGTGFVRSAPPGSWPGYSLVYSKLELRFPMLERRVYFQHIDFALGGVVFTDAGVVWKERFDGRRLGAGAVGLGLRVYAPFIEVGRIDYSWSPVNGSVIKFGRGHSF